MWERDCCSMGRWGCVARGGGGGGETEVCQRHVGTHKPFSTGQGQRSVGRGPSQNRAPNRTENHRPNEACCSCSRDPQKKTWPTITLRQLQRNHPPCTFCRQRRRTRLAPCRCRPRRRRCRRHPQSRRAAKGLGWGGVGPQAWAAKQLGIVHGLQNQQTAPALRQHAQHSPLLPATLPANFAPAPTLHLLSPAVSHTLGVVHAHAAAEPLHTPPTEHVGCRAARGTRGVPVGLATLHSTSGAPGQRAMACAVHRQQPGSRAGSLAVP